MPRSPRNYAAEYAARKARAAELGRTGAAAYGHAKRAAEATARQINRQAERAAKPAKAKRPLTPKQQAAAAKRRMTRQFGDARIVKTRSARRIFDETKAADTRGDKIAYYITVFHHGQWRTIVIDGFPRISPKAKEVEAPDIQREVQIVMAPPAHATWSADKPGLYPHLVLGMIAFQRREGLPLDVAVWEVLAQLANDYTG